MAIGSNNPFPSVLILEGSAPSSPSAGNQRLYVDSSDHVLKLKNSSGTVSTLPVNPMTTAQDVIVGGASGAPGRLAIGAAGASLGVLNSVVAYNSGTSMPGSKATGDRYWRTDLGLEAYWDGAQWLTVNKYHMVIPAAAGSDVSSSSSSAYFRAPLWNAVYDLYLIDYYAMTFVSTTNDGTNKWTLTLSKESKAAAYTQTTIVSFSTGTTPDTATQFIVHTVAINALVGTSSGTLTVGVTKVAAPGNMTSSHAVTYRVVLT